MSIPQPHVPPTLKNVDNRLIKGGQKYLENLWAACEPSVHTMVTELLKPKNPVTAQMRALGQKHGPSIDQDGFNWPHSVPISPTGIASMIAYVEGALVTFDGMLTLRLSATGGRPHTLGQRLNAEFPIDKNADAPKTKESDAAHRRKR
jgi:hypothetical protein